MIGEGSAECERLWHVNEMNGEPVLTLSRIDRPTCLLRRDHEGVWRGAWLEHEKMPIELVPFAQWTPVQDRIEPKRDLLIITIATGKTFNELLEVTGPVLEEYAENVGADFVALTNATQQWWGLEKFRVLEFAKQYERTLYIDADVILRDSAPNLFELVPRGYVAMHDDWPHLPSYDWLWSERAAILGSQGRPMDRMETAWNTGIVLCDRDQADIWQPPLPHSCHHTVRSSSGLRVARGSIRSFKYQPSSIPVLDAKIQRAIASCQDRSLGKLSELQAS